MYTERVFAFLGFEGMSNVNYGRSIEDLTLLNPAVQRSEVRIIVVTLQIGNFPFLTRPF
ncbi:hypothetical protein HYC85_028061 [Camellia sinensis]|uniref:Uncharacterized protein n=1 Tax=Camellia sinensis TaxID=4442 RepID=A0A7J7FU25_CAMSI|nr:hypothetical protein HYC85_028061 [Camellia sinensis]